MDQQNKNIIIGSINWNVINTISQTILTFGVAVILARILDPNDFGLFGLTIILLGIINLLFTGSISRFIKQKENLDAQDIESSLGISILFSLLAYLIVWVISPLVASFFNDSIRSDLIRVYTVSIFFISVSSILRGILIKKMNCIHLFYSDLIAIVFGYSIIGIILALNNFGVFSLKDLGVGKQQLVEIAKALRKDVKLLILDEPTAALNEDDSENLLNLLRGLKEHGVTCIMISHKLKEVIEIADTVTVLRDGQTICTLDKSEVSEFVLIKNMVGREINNIYPERQRHLFKSAGAAVDAAKASGVKVISYDRLITNTKAIDYFVTFDSRAVGTLQAQYLVDHAEGRSNPLYLYAGALTDPNSFIFFQGAWDGACSCGPGSLSQ